MSVSTLKEIGWTQPPIQEQIVAFGVPIAESIPESVKRLSMSRVAVVTTNSLAGPGGLAEQVKKILGPKFHSMTAGARPHTPRSQAVRVAKALEGADGVIAIGGSSVSDTVKAARLCLANGITHPDEMDRIPQYHKPPGPGQDLNKNPSLPFVAIPTTLSAGEFTFGAGITDERGPVKQIFLFPRLGPDIVILDPEMTRNTPPHLFFSTGMRAVDHAVETWLSNNPTPLSDAYSLHGARLLITSMRKAFSAPDNMQARLDCQKGCWLAVLGVSGGDVKAGASHGFGHALGGTGGMPHGETSCVMLHHVLRFNAPVDGEKQAVLAAAVGEPGKPLADIVLSLVKHLGLPSRIRDTVVKESQLDAIAAEAMHDACIRANPRPIKELSQVRQLLQEAW